MKRLLALTLCLALTACMNNQDAGTLTGAAIGGTIGHSLGRGSDRAAGLVVGTLVGAVIGNKIGETMDKVDRSRMNRALERTQTGKTSSWTNPDTRARYRVTPTKTFVRKSGWGESQPCREYITKVSIGGKQRQAHGTACRELDGSWKIIS